MEILSAENLVRIFKSGDKTVHALDDLSFDVQKGEFLSVVGTSGSGKSTLLHILGTVDQPDRGKVWLAGTDVFKLRHEQLAVFRRRRVGIIFQFNNLLHNMTVKENILLPMLLDGRKADMKHYRELIATLGLEGLDNDLPYTLSGGQKQRVLIGRAMINTPDVLLADEPTGNLDAHNTREILHLLKKYNHDYGQTIILITHDEQVALQADRMLTIEKGKKLYDIRIK